MESASPQSRRNLEYLRRLNLTPEMLVESQRKKAFNTARRFFYNEADAQDATQEILLHLYERIDRFRPERCLTREEVLRHFGGYAHIVLTRALYDQYRRRVSSATARREKTLSLDGIMGDECDEMSLENVIVDDREEYNPEAVCLQKAEWVRLRKKAQQYLARLHPSLSGALYWVDGCELSYEEAAQQMNCTINTIRSRVHRARRHLGITPMCKISPEQLRENRRLQNHIYNTTKRKKNRLQGSSPKRAEPLALAS